MHDPLVQVQYFCTQIFNGQQHLIRSIFYPLHWLCPLWKIFLCVGFASWNSLFFFTDLYVHPFANIMLSWLLKYKTLAFDNAVYPLCLIFKIVLAIVYNLFGINFIIILTSTLRSCWDFFFIRVHFICRWITGRNCHLDNNEPSTYEHTVSPIYVFV